MNTRPIRVMMLGLRGFPGVQGGVEVHAENLCTELVKLGCEPTVLSRSPYHNQEIGDTWNGIKFVTLWAPKSKALETILHSILGVFYAAIKRPDILHIQAIGPAIVTPIARLFGLQVVVTHHGPDYDRQKWGGLGRFVLKAGEYMGMRFANKRIVISKVIGNLVLEKHAKQSDLIPNGVILLDLPESQTILESFGLIKGRYILLVSRLVPEKRHMDLIDAFVKAELNDWKLVLVGGSDHPDAYMQELLAKIAVTSDVVHTGFQSGLALKELYTHAGIFVLPSSHEGLPIALLEALSYGLPVIASDIPANLEINLSEDHYFPLGDVETLSSKLVSFSKKAWSDSERNQIREFVKARYNWEDIAKQTLLVYQSICRKQK